VSDIDSMISRLTDRQRQEFAIACARRVQHLMTDPRSIAALDTRERWLRGKATNEEMTAALASARAAADAAWAAWAAADAARAAAWDAAWDAGAAAGAAAEAAGDAKWTAERAWQIEELERMLGEGGGA
jgi:hypothetical protein